MKLVNIDTLIFKDMIVLSLKNLQLYVSNHLCQILFLFPEYKHLFRQVKRRLFKKLVDIIIVNWIKIKKMWVFGFNL